MTLRKVPLSRRRPAPPARHKALAVHTQVTLVLMAGLVVTVLSAALAL